MGYGLRAGDICLMQNDYLLDGKLIFSREEEVKIEDVDPDPKAPGLKYVVRSKTSGSRFRLSGRDLKRKFCPECGALLISLGNNCPECIWVVPGKEDLFGRKTVPGSPRSHGSGVI